MILWPLGTSQLCVIDRKISFSEEESRGSKRPKSRSKRYCKIQKKTETNSYTQNMKTQTNTLHHARIKSWYDNTYKEIKIFLSMILWMGIMRLPQVRNCWSKNDIYINKINISWLWNRFEILTKTWHFYNNSNPPKNDQLYKTTPLINMLVDHFQYAYISGEEYIPNKRYKFGIKLYKLCLQGSYTYKASGYGIAIF